MEGLKRKSRASLVLGLSIFVMGGCGLAYEYTFSKISSDVLGNSVQQWAVIIGVMLFFMGIGSDFQKYLKNEGLLDKIVIIEVLLGLVGGFGPLIMLLVYGKFTAHFTLIQYALIGSVGLMIGMEIPLVARINESYTKSLGVNLAGVLKMDYIGSLCGALLWVFLLPKFFTLVESAYILGLLTVFAATFTAFYFRDLIKSPSKIALLIIAGFLSLGFGLSQAKKWSFHAEQYLYRDRIIYSETTKYQHIVLSESSRGEFSCYINGHLQFNDSTEQIYHENLVHPAMHIAHSRKRVLILGGGDGMALREVLKYQDVKEVLLVDLDPEMTKLAKTHERMLALNKASLLDSRLVYIENHELVGNAKEDIYELNQKRPFGDNSNKVATVTVLNVDAMRYVEQVPGFFDVVILDFPDPNSLELAKLYSLRFYEHLKAKLNPQGILVQQSSSPFYAKEAFLCIGRTMTVAGMATVPYHDNVPAFGEWGWWIAASLEHYNAKKLITELRAVDEMRVELRYLTPELIHASLSWGIGALSSEYTDFTTLSSPKVFEYYLRAWNEM